MFLPSVRKWIPWPDFVTDLRLAALWEHVVRSVGGSLTAAQELIADRARVAMHWAGGRHHAKPDMAAGFCYVWAPRKLVHALVPLMCD